MILTYNILGMTCNGCVDFVKSQLLKLPSVISVEVSLEEKKVVIEMINQISTSDLQTAISPSKKYIITDKNI